jgi:endonuclease-3
MSHQAKSNMLNTIRREFPAKVWKPDSPFETLIHTILSQNTNDRNSEAAMRRLEKRYKITPKALSKAHIGDIIRCIRSAGLYRSKAPRIIEVAKVIAEQYGGRLSPILRLPYDQAKETLISLPGVGPKTADILLAFVAKRPVIPVDTHIARVSRRLGITPPNADYERIRRSLESLIPPRNRLQLHLSLIAFGRAICKAPRPRCPICPVNDLCPSSTVTHEIRQN